MRRWCFRLPVHPAGYANHVEGDGAAAIDGDAVDFSDVLLHELRFDAATEPFGRNERCPPAGAWPIVEAARSGR